MKRIRLICGFSLMLLSVYIIVSNIAVNLLTKKQVNFEKPLVQHSKGILVSKNNQF